MKRVSSAFTLIEFAITLLVAAIFITLAVPGYFSVVQNNKIASMTNKLSASFSFARMEAVRRGVRVSVCPAASSALSSCGTASQWSQGWIVFVDSNNNNLVDSTTDLVKVSEAIPNGATITTTSSIVSYDSSGFVTTGNVTFALSASGCTGSNGRILTVSSSGRLSVAAAACS